MRTIFEVTDPNSDGLLTVAEARLALGLTDGSRDADLTRMIARVSAGIYRACNLRTDGINPPSLLSEDITETFRLECMKPGALQLSRRRVSEVTTLTEAGAEITIDTDYEIDRASGQLLRLGSTEAFGCWPSGKIVVEYSAGFETIPDDLKLAAETWLRVLWRDAYQTPGNVSDPFEKVREIPGVIRTERWISQMTVNQMVSLLPPEVESILYDGGYIETWIA